MRVLAENLGRLARDGRCAQAARRLSVHPTQTELGMHLRAGSQIVFRGRRLRQLSFSGRRFYVPSSGRGQRLELAKQLSGDIALQAPLDVADGLALGEATLHVILCAAVLTHSDQHDGVERAVELSVSRSVESVPDERS